MYGLPEFTAGGTLRRTFGIFRRHAPVLLALSALLYAFPLTAVGLLPKLGYVPGAETFRAAAADGDPLPSLTALIVYGLVMVLVLTSGILLSTAATVWVSIERLHGRPASFAGAVAAALRALPANFAMVVVSSLAVVAASLLLVVPGIMLFCRWSAALPVLLVEHAGPLGSLGRSRDLTRGHRWAILGFLLVVAVCNGVFLLAAGLGGAALGGLAGGDAGLAIATSASFAVRAIVVAVNGAATAALYFELRQANDGVLSSETVEAFA